MLGMIRRNFVDKHQELKCTELALLYGAVVRHQMMIQEIFIRLYNSTSITVLVRPHLEYAVQDSWKPYLRKDIDLIEGVQT